MTTRASDKITSALFDALGTADPTAVVKLREAVSEYEKVYGRTYRSIRQQPFCRGLLDAITEAGDLAVEVNRISARRTSSKKEDTNA